MKFAASIRVLPRLLLLCWIILSGMVSLAWFLMSGRGTARDARIAWMQWMSRRFLSLLRCKVSVTGVVPSCGLIACNHLGYVDILVIGSVCPAIFVAKSDVAGWPLFGWLSRNAGTIFVSRESPSEVPAQLRQMEGPLHVGVPVVLFPEGTSSDGTRVLPFRSSLLEAAVHSGLAVTPASVGYDLSGDGDVGQEIAYWGDHTLLPHLVNLLSKHSFAARLHFGAPRRPSADRKIEAKILHQEVSAIHRSFR